MIIYPFVHILNKPMVWWFHPLHPPWFPGSVWGLYSEEGNRNTPATSYPKHYWLSPYKHGYYIPLFSHHIPLHNIILTMCIYISIYPAVYIPWYIYIHIINFIIGFYISHYMSHYTTIYHLSPGKCLLTPLVFPFLFLPCRCRAKAIAVQRDTSWRSFWATKYGGRLLGGSSRRL